jgi:hypothetical protein
MFNFTTVVFDVTSPPVIYFCSFNYNKSVADSYEPLYLKNILKMPFTVSLMCTQPA